MPSTSAISQASDRLGEPPPKLLFERIAVPMACRGTRGSWFRGLRGDGRGDGHRRPRSQACPTSRAFVEYGELAPGAPPVQARS